MTEDIIKKENLVEYILSHREKSDETDFSEREAEEMVDRKLEKDMRNKINFIIDRDVIQEREKQYNMTTEEAKKYVYKQMQDRLDRISSEEDRYLENMDEYDDMMDFNRNDPEAVVITSSEQEEDLVEQLMGES